MAALVAGVQYGLSSHSTFHENKSLIFVKLTDSAQRAIEDFLRNRNKINQNPTIQFLGNEGQLSFPSTQSSHGSAGFTFSLSGNQDVEGPQGGFECIQQTGPTSLESLGALPCKMRIKANDDVYETTRHRMAVAEENSKNKCTRVIKPNGPDIGRKVKLKGTGRTIPPPSNSNSRHRESTSIPTSASQSRLSSSTSSSTSSSSYKAAPSSNATPVRSQPEKKVSDIMRRPLKERLIHLLALRPYKKPELYDRINREGIKERERSIMTMILKQVAFMRDNTYHLHRHVWNDVQEDWPYYTEQEKAMLKRRKPQNLTPPGSSDGGSSGSGQSPNSTHPGSPPGITAPPPSLVSNKRPGYYQGNDGLPTKRPRISHYRKPESSNSNLSSSTTSSSSKGNGENGRTAGSSGGSNGSNSVVNSAGVGGGSVGGCASGGNSNNSGGLFDVWEQRQQQRERRADYRGERTSNSEQVLRSGGTSYVTSSKSCLTSSGNGANDTGNQLDQRENSNIGNEGTYSNTTGHNSFSHNSLTHSNSSCNSRHHYAGGGNSGSSGGGGGSGGSGSGSTGGNSGKSTICTGDNVDYVARSTPSSVGTVNSSAAVTVAATTASTAAVNAVATTSVAATIGGTTGGAHSALPNGVATTDRRDRSERSRGDRDSRESRRRTNNAASTNSYDLSSSGYNGTTEDATVSTSTCNIDMPESPKSSEYPDYLTCYTTISSAEQRRRYKEEFNADYEEYKRLHAQVVKVSKRFTQLEERLKQEEAIGNWEGFKEVERQIFTEYNETKRDPVYRETKRRFHYLHEKLSHLKRLVLEYDTQNTSASSMMIATANGNGSNGSSNSSSSNTAKESKEMDSLHY